MRFELFVTFLSYNKISNRIEEQESTDNEDNHWAFFILRMYFSDIRKNLRNLKYTKRTMCIFLFKSNKSMWQKEI